MWSRLISGEQVFEILFGLNQGKFFENIPQVTIGHQDIGLGGLEKTENIGAECCTNRDAGKQTDFSDHSKTG